MTEYTISPQGRRLAYNRSAGKGPGVVFLGGFKSDMEGSKARFLHDWATAQGRAFLRFDYSGMASPRAISNRAASATGLRTPAM